MNRTEFIKALSIETGKTQKELKELLDVMQDIVYKEMAAEGEVKLFDGVTLAGVKKEARTARNPQTGASIQLESRVVPKAKFGKAIKDYLKEGK